jgi:excisionase family DNA binding protein
MSETVRLNSIKDIVARTRLSRSKLYQEMDSGRLQSVKIGRRRLITESALVDYITTLVEVGTPGRRYQADADR